jgi:hypothetical protein
MAETITQITQPPKFIEAESKLYLDQLRKAIGGLKGVDLSKIMGPQFVAGMDPLTQQAIGMAGGLGSYAPYLQAAESYSGPDAYKAFMSPYQQEVIGTTLSEYDIQAQKGAQGVPAAAIAAGAFGGGREGVQRAEYGAASDRNRAALQAQFITTRFWSSSTISGSSFWSTNEFSTSCSTISGTTDCGFNYIGWFNTSSKPSSTFCSTTISTSNKHINH